jgi:hypothetical protein
MKYDTICREYLSLLQKNHSNHNIKAELKKADEGFYYRDSLPQPKTENELIWENIKCGFKFYGVDVVYNEFEFGDTKKKLQQFREPRYEKAYQLNEFRTSPLYKMIANLTDK